MAVLSVEGLSKRYGARLAVDDVTLEVGANEVLGLLGPNGSGKSTILKIVTGYLQPSAGRASVSGLDVSRDGREARRHVGYVPEDVPLYDHMRVGEFLGFMGQLHGLRGAPLQRAVDLAVERLALGSVRDTVIERLSHGFRQRVSLAQAVLHEPPLLVLDEPTNGLDPRQIIELRSLIRELARDSAVIVTSHILAEIQRVADRVAILLDGRLLTVERIEQETRTLLIEAPAGSAAAVAETLARADGIVADAVDRPDGGASRLWRVRTDGPGTAARLRSDLLAAGITVAFLDEVPSDLETRFLELTRSRTDR